MKNILFVSALILLVACSSSRITASWNAKDVTPKKYNKILVLGVIKEDDLELKKNMEKHLVNDLRMNGYNAISSIEEYGPKAFSDTNEDKALRKIRKSGVDAVVTIVLLSKQQEKEYVPARVYYSPYITYHNRLWGYYSTMTARIYEPGYYQEKTNFFWESNFYTMEDSRKLLYSVQTKSFNPGNTATLAHEYGRLIINHMIKTGVLISDEVITH